MHIGDPAGSIKPVFAKVWHRAKKLSPKAQWERS